MKNLDYGRLLEIYGKILTVKQRKLMELYYWEDLSLGEISEDEGITRQAVRDSIKRSEQLLEGYEKKLGFIEKIRECREGCAKIAELADDINPKDSRTGEIKEEIKALAAKTGETF